MQYAMRFLSIFLLLAAAPVIGAEKPVPLPPDLGKFFTKHCLDCHGPDLDERGLRFDKQSTDLADADVALRWEKVFDKLSRRQMPPPANKKQPTDAERKTAVESLRKTLHNASLARQQKDGRVVLRRLNRNELEHSLHDLLTPRAQLKGMIPEDKEAGGFDKVSTALETSSEHLLRYQEVAEKAILATIPAGPQVPIKIHHTGLELTTKSMHAKFIQKETVDKIARLEGDTLLMYARPFDYVPIHTPSAKSPGRYRVRLSAYAINTNGKPLPVTFVCRDDYGRSDADIRGVHDVPPDKAAVFEEEVELKSREMIVFVTMSLPHLRNFGGENNNAKNVDLATYKGPGLAIEWADIEGPLDKSPGVGYERAFGDGKGKTLKDAEPLVRKFVSLALRRPADKDLLKYYVDMVGKWLDKGLSFQEAITIAHKAILSSPRFLFLNEKPGKLDDYDVASRLSYFLWSSIPDDELLALAEKGTLTKPENLRAQTERMLKDPKAKRFSDDFVGQWLDLKKIDATAPDGQRYGEFDEVLYWSIQQETFAFFNEILKNDLSLVEFTDSDWACLNERLAQHYGIPGVHGGEIRKVTLPKGSHRGGVITQASVLKVTADGTTTSPVLRGKWVLERIVGLPPEPPPPGIPAIEPDIRGATTIRQQLDKHRNNPSCAACHNHIDPPGFALENFDVIGGWRDFYRISGGQHRGFVELTNYPGRKVLKGPDVEQGGKTPDGKSFKDIDQYKQILLEDKDQLVRNLAQKLIIYATGAELQFADREVVEDIVVRVRKAKYGFRSLIHEVIQSRLFLNK